MRPNLQFPVDLVTFTEEILNGKLRFCAVSITCFSESRTEHRNIDRSELHQSTSFKSLTNR